MTTTSWRGSPQFPGIAGDIQPSTQDTMDAAVQTLQAQKDAWVALPVRERITLIERLIKDFAAIAPRWVSAGQQAKGITGDSPLAGEEWALGPWPVLKNLHQLRRSLIDIEVHGRPRIPGPVTTRPDGQVVARVFPQTPYDRLFFSSVTAEIWMEPGVTAEELPQTQALAYQSKQHTGKVVLVLGAGNVSSIGPMDILYKMFVEDAVVLLKMNPVNAYLLQSPQSGVKKADSSASLVPTSQEGTAYQQKSPGSSGFAPRSLLEEGFAALIEPGFLRMAYGGAEQGEYLCNHPGVDEIHITGSDKTFEAIVFGAGPQGAARKAAHQPLQTRPVTGELGNVSPVIVVPGPWRPGDLAYQAEHIVSMLTNNAGFNCNATRVIIQYAGWQQRETLLQQLRRLLALAPTRGAYYPGAQERRQAFVSAHPEAEQFGEARNGQNPWTLIAGLDPAQEDDICFTTEAFCGLFAETTLEAANTPQYIARAVAFANERLWGTLNATLLVHPDSLKDVAIAAAVERAVADLRYGTVGVNYWAGTGYALAATTWGAFPGHDIYNIQSGTGVVHNTLMFSRAQKSVVRGPFRSIPTPPWFATRGRIARKVFPRLNSLEAAPSLLKMPAIMWAALTG